MALSDEEIKKQAVDGLYWDTRVDAAKVSVQVENGRVILTGTVPGYNVRMRAAEDAWNVDGVVWVENRILVRPPPAVPIASDEDIKESVVRALAEDLETADIRVLVNDATVVLEGSVDEYWKKSEAEWIACRARGVCDIENKLAVAPTMSIMDRAIADDVRAANERNRNVNIGDVDITVTDGVVTLSGSVPNRAALRAAVNAAEFTRGVVDVVDELAIEAPGERVEAVC
ncbi:MAG: BON domain-containing protein [Methanomicrobiaceae archaeon]|uniref:Osmotically inducible protein y n=1 Tax=hydrocarbon metagenome TaxID=938273 RepID=A0A0W8FFK1_9ZZZZ|nr:BON domain-containing protein [Methanomicrobiaceae archaeon]MDD5419592.1 BON domain-containing protein [Methanomicrobiaceae archaeon]